MLTTSYTMRTKGRTVLARLFFSCALALFAAPAAFAMPKDHGAGDCAACHTLTEKEAAKLLHKLGGTVKSVRLAPVAGLFELLMEKDGKQGTVYIDFAKKRLLQGMIVDLETLDKVTAFEDKSHRMPQAVYVDPKIIPVGHALVMGNPQGKKKLYVFIDPDCPYCAKMYGELVKLEQSAPDVAIYLLLYPLPVHPDAYDKARSIVDSRSRTQLEKAFSGEKLYIPGKYVGVKEVDEVIVFARRHEIVATPTAVLSDGSIVTGYKDAEELKQLIDGAR